MSTGKLLGILSLVFGAILLVAILMMSGKSPDENTATPSPTPAKPSMGSESPTAVDPGTTPGVRQGGEIPVEPVRRAPTSGRNTVSLRGHVKNNLGNPVAGALVTAEQGVANLFSAIQGEQEKFSTSSKTDSNGAYVFEGLPPHENYVLTASHPEYASARHTYIPVHEDQPTEAPDLVLDSGYTVSGTVLDKDKNPVAGATVSAEPTFLNPFMRPSKSEEDRSVKTDGAGAFRITRLPAGQISLTAKAKGHGSRTVPNLLFTPEKRTIEQEIVLEESRAIGGRVVEASGKPVVGAKVDATSYSSQNPSRGTAVSDEQGSFSISDVANGTYVLVVSAENFTTKRENRVTPGETVTVTLMPQGAVAGRVIAKKDGRPVESFSLEARKTLPNGKDFVRIAATARSFRSKDGAFQYGGLDPEASYVLIAMADGFAPTISAPFAISGADPVTGLEIALSKGGSLRGTVIDGKTLKPVPGASVLTRDNGYVENPLTQMFGISQQDNMQREVRTGIDGSFSLDHVMPATVQIEISAPGYTSRFLKDLVVSEDQNNSLGQIALSAGGSIAGMAVDSAGRPLGGAEVSVRATTPGSLLSRSVLTDQTGRFVVRNLPPGDYSVAVSSGTLNAGNIFEKIKQINENKKAITVREGEEIAGLSFVVN